MQLLGLFCVKSRCENHCCATASGCVNSGIVDISRDMVHFIFLLILPLSIVLQILCMLYDVRMVSL